MPAVPQSFIKNVALQIRASYQLDNAPFSIKDDRSEKKKWWSWIKRCIKWLTKQWQILILKKKSEEQPKQKPMPFIGRELLQAKFLEFLHGNSGKGVFLVTGFRGMGKTSFVNHVIGRYCDRDPGNKKRKPGAKKRIIPINLTLAQNHPKEIDILRLLVRSVNDQYREFKYDRKLLGRFWESTTKGKYYAWKLAAMPFLFLIGFFFAIKTIFWQEHVISTKFLVNEHFFWIPVRWILGLARERFLLLYLFIYILVLVVLRLRASWAEKSNAPNNRIRRLMESCYASLSEEYSSGEEYKIPYIKSKFTDTGKQTRQYPIAETKQIEYELNKFLESARKKHKLEFIFIFDELDKVEPVVNSSNLYEELETFENKKTEAAYERETRDRKQAIINIIASLKNFFTTADARFIFIAGREMFDASLADIADRQSSISSIFTYVFNIESLLKEVELNDSKGFNHSNRASLSNAIEAYLKEVLFDTGADGQVSEQLSLYKMALGSYRVDSLDEKNKEAELHSKLYFTLQNFVTYLTYRSNGSPQKLIKAIHEFILVKKDLDDDEGKNLVYKLKDEPPAAQAQTLYLHFNYDNQYRIGFINYLYRPFLIRRGGNFKLFSDNITVSTPYIFDHLLKYHPFAFSLSNMEMTPEVLSTNKTPSLRQHIRQIIDHLGANHMRETELTLFDYKFYSRTQNEITYVSKIFEQEAAAFNFTLDESYLVKLHVANKIKGLRSVYHKFLGTGETNQQIFSISHLNEILGDLFFFDQEYDDAIAAYSDGIKLLSQLDVGAINMRDFVTLIKNKLKLGLCFEKTNSYEEALALYSDCCLDAKRFMVSRIVNSEAVNIDSWYQSKTPRTNRGFKEAIFYTSGLSNLLKTILQGFLAKIFMQEKLGAEGISNLKLSMGIGGFLKLTEGFLDDGNRNHILKANAWMFTGKLFYFKNNTAPFPAENKQQKNNVPINLIPEKFYKQMMGIQGSVGSIAGVRNGSISALTMYIFGFYEVLSTKYNLSAFVKKIDAYGLNATTTTTDPDIIDLLISEAETRINEGSSNLRGVHYRYMGTLLSSIGDCLLGMCGASSGSYNKIGISKLFTKIKRGAKFTDLLQPSTHSVDLVGVLKCYYLSGQYFQEYGRKISCSFQYNKILHVLKIALCEDGTDAETRLSFLKMLEREIVVPLLQISSETSKNSDTHIIEKAFRHGVDHSFSVNNISYHPESREAALLYYAVAIKVGDSPDIGNLVSSYNSFGTQHARMIELDFYARYLYKQEIDPHPIRNVSKATIVNYLFTMFTLLRIQGIYGASYALGPRYLAFTHFHIAEILNRCRHRSAANMKKIIANLNALLGYRTYNSLHALFHYQRANELFEQTLQLHQGGTEYKKMLSDMIYLEDDFNDNAYHFGAALDRYLLVNGVLQQKITRCDEQIKELGKQNYTAGAYLELGAVPDAERGHLWQA